MNERGQALVEFIMILPVLLFIVLGMVDFGNIFHQKYKLENDLDFVTDLYHENKQEEINSYISKNKIKIYFTNEEEFTIIGLSKKVNITTPGLNLILKDPYYVTVERYVYEK